MELAKQQLGLGGRLVATPATVPLCPRARGRRSGKESSPASPEGAAAGLNSWFNERDGERRRNKRSNFLKGPHKTRVVPEPVAQIEI